MRACWATTSTETREQAAYAPRHRHLHTLAQESLWYARDIHGRQTKRSAMGWIIPQPAHLGPLSMLQKRSGPFTFDDTSVVTNFAGFAKTPSRKLFWHFCCMLGPEIDP